MISFSHLLYTANINGIINLNKLFIFQLLKKKQDLFSLVEICVIAFYLHSRFETFGKTENLYFVLMNRNECWKINYFLVFQCPEDDLA